METKEGGVAVARGHETGLPQDIAGAAAAVFADSLQGDGVAGRVVARLGDVGGRAISETAQLLVLVAAGDARVGLPPPPADLIPRLRDSVGDHGVNGGNSAGAHGRLGGDVLVDHGADGGDPGGDGGFLSCCGGALPVGDSHGHTRGGVGQGVVQNFRVPNRVALDAQAMLAR
uniref:Uncharacterized protein n=1 Tax=Triticum urartu TaxID=4572 RepID=A0A8R7QE33_TRIUA